MFNEDQIAQRAAEAKKNNQLINIQANELSTLDMEAGVQGIARDHLNESMFGADDFVILKNIFDGSEHNGYQMPSLAYVFQYGGRSYRVKPGQQFTLNGAQAYIYVKHVVSLIYRRVQGEDEEDRRTYSLDNPWVRAIVVERRETLNPDGGEAESVQDIPEYMKDDPNLQKNIGGGEVELNTQYDDADASDEQIDKVPDFSPNLNPRNEFNEEGQIIENETPQKQEEEFPGAKKNTSQKKK